MRAYERQAIGKIKRQKRELKALAVKRHIIAESNKSTIQANSLVEAAQAVGDLIKKICNAFSAGLKAFAEAMEG